MRPKFDSGCTFRSLQEEGSDEWSGVRSLSFVSSKTGRWTNCYVVANGKEKDVYDVIIFDTRARHGNLNACISAILHLESAANVFNLGVEIRN